jgi:thiosulfate dehydrogenase
LFLAGALAGALLGGTVLASGPALVPLPAAPARPIPAGPLGDAILYGQRIVNDTQGTVRNNVRSGLDCSSCHLGGGQVAFAAPFAGLPGLFPEFRSRAGRVESLEERINDCFRRSMNGRALAPASPEMIGLLAYMSWLSQGVPAGAEVVGRGFRDLKAPGPPDPVRGMALYGARCAGCHGTQGQGTPKPTGGFVFPPLWGAQSFNDGAGMARVSIAAAFVQAKMPLGAGGTLSDQDAFDIAAFFTSQPRPAFTAAVHDWPAGDRPADATTATRRPPQPAGTRSP